jgi:phage shock protein PspC (stress-responsive transcriptional regulator)
MDSRRTSLPGSPQLGVQPRIWRSGTNKVFAGVVGGLAERLNVSATGLRWFWVIMSFMTGIMPGLVAYLILWAITSVRTSGTDQANTDAERQRYPPRSYV